MKLLYQNPAPPLFTGHSPPSQHGDSNAAPSNQPRFGQLPPNAMAQFTADTDPQSVEIITQVLD